MIVLGVDGGGSSTRAVLADDTGRVLGRGAAGASNPLSVGREQAEHAIEAAVSAAWVTARTERRPADAATLGIAGLLGARETAAIEEITRDLSLVGSTDRLSVSHDLHIALCGGLGGRPGVVLVAGTGSAAYARPQDQTKGVIVGGKGALAGDSGSAYWIAHRALRTAMKQLDGRLPETELAGCVLDFLGVQDVPQLVEKLYLRRPRAYELARLCPRIVKLHEGGDEAASGIVAAAQSALATMVDAAVRRTGITDPEVVIAGSLGQSEPFRHGLTRAIGEAVGSARFPKQLLPPVGGAVLEALRLAGVQAGEALVDRLAADL